jgi:hypothetical protein
MVRNTWFNRDFESRLRVPGPLYRVAVNLNMRRGFPISTQSVLIADASILFIQA